jgi:ArsR family transcriptional regulator
MMKTPITFAKALADSTRQTIMELLCCQWLNVSDIVARLNVTQPTVSHHLGILRSAGLVNVQREGKQVFYTLNQEKVAANCCQLVELFAPEQTVFTIQETSGKTAD